MQKVKRLNWFIIICASFLGVEGAYSIDDNLLSESERTAIDGLINSPSVVGLNKDVQSLSEDFYLNDEVNNEAKRTLSSLKSAMKSASIQLIDSIEVERGGERSILLEMGRLSKKAKSIRDDLKAQNETISEIQSLLRKKRRQLEIAKDVLRSEKVSLREKIITRLRAESGHKVSASYQGVFQCSTQKSLTLCLSEPGRKADILSLASASIGGSWDIDDISGYEISDANMSLTGEVNYHVKFDYVKGFNKKTMLYLNNALGLSNFSVVLSSNEEVEYFVDGVSFGYGRRIAVALDAGYHAFYVKGRSGAASIVRSVNKDSKLHIPISSKENTPPHFSPPKSLAKPHIKESQSSTSREISYTISGFSVYLPASESTSDKDSYPDQGNVFRRLAFLDAAEFCHSLGRRVASQSEYAKILKSSDFQNNIGLKSSYWLNAGLVVSRMGDGVLAKRASDNDKYNVICVNE